MVESTATLREEIKALSGVDIMASATEFKSTYQILDELSEKWEDLSDIAQATIIEKMAGKHQGNVFSSLMENFDTARAALETSLNSSGSAMQEHEKWQKSLEAQILSLKASWQGLSQAFLSSDFLSGAIKGLTGLVDVVTKLVDTIGPIPALLGTFGAIKGLLSFPKIFKTIVNGGGLSQVGGILGALAETFPTAANGASLLSSSLKNMVTALQEVSVASGGAGSAIGGFFRLLLQHPYVTAAVVAITALTAAFAYQKKQAEDLAKEVDKTVSSYKEQHSELKKLKNDYDTSNESSMISRYEELSKGIGTFNENISLTTDEYAEYQNIVGTIAEQIPSLVTGFDSQGNAILSCKDNVKKLSDEYQNLIHKQNQEILTNSGKIEEDFSNTLEKQSGDHWWTNNHGFWKGFDFFKLADYELKDDTVDELSNILNAKTEEQRTQLIDNLRNIDNGYSAAEIRTALEGAGVDVKWHEDVYDVLEETLKTDPQKISGIVDNYFAQFAELVEQQKSIAQAKLSDAFDISNAISGLNYDNIGEDLQNIAYQTINSLDYNFFKELKNSGKTVEQWTTELLGQLNAIGKDNKTEIETGFDLQTKFNGGEISYGEYVGNLRNLESTIDKLELKDEAKNQLKISLGLDDGGIVDQYDALVKRLSDSKKYDFKISEEEARNFLDGLSAEERQVAIDVIAELDENGVYEGIEDLKSIIDREMVLSGLVFDLNLEVEAAGIESLNTALSESVTASGLSSESISALKSRYAELESQGWDLSSMFEETSHGIHVNRNELSKFENELSKQKLSEVNNDLDRMKKEYDKLGEAIKNASGAEKASLFDKRQSLAQKISEAATLAAQYEGLTSAYNQWLAAEESGNERDMYENVLSGFETVKDELSRGWADDSTIAFLEMLTGRADLAGKSGKELKEVYDGLGKTIENTKYSVKDFFTTDKDGNSTSKGVYNFLDAVGQLEEEKFGYKDVVKRDDKGNVIGFDFELAGGDEAIAEALGVSEELVQIMVRAADDAGFVVSMDGTYRQLADLQNEAKAAADYLKEIGKTDFEFDFNTSNVENLNTQLEKAREIWKSKEFWNEDGTFNFDADGAEQAMQVVSTLQAKIDDLTQKKYGIGLTVEDKEFEEPLEKLQSYGDKVGLLNQLELNPKVHVEEIDKLEGELDDIAEYFANLDKDTKVKVGLEADDNVDEVKKKIESGEIKIPTTLDIQTNIDKNIEDLKDIMLLNWLPEDSDEAKAIKIRLGLEVEPEVKNPEAVDEEVQNTVKPNLPTPTIETPVEIKPTSHVQADKFLEENKIETGASGQKEYRIGLKLTPEVTNPEAVDNAVAEVTEGTETKSEPVTTTQDVNVETGEVKTEGFWDKVKSFLFGGSKNEGGVATGAEGRKNAIGVVETSADAEVNVDNVKTKGTEKVDETVKEEVGKTTTVEKSVELDLSVKEYQEVLQDLKDADKEITIDVTTNGLEDVIKLEESIGNINENINLSADIEGNVDSLTKFADGAKALGEIDSNIAVYVTAEIEGNAFETSEDKLNNLKVFAEGAKEIQDVESNYITIDANVSGNVLETAEKKIDNLKIFAEGAKELEGTESNYVTISANVDGNVVDTADEKIKNIKTFAEVAKELQSTKDVEISVVAEVSGSALDSTEDKLENLKTFAEGAKELQGIKDIKTSVSVNLEGNLNDSETLENLAQFAEGAKELQGVKDSKVTITASLNGNLIEKTKDKIDNLVDFAEGAKALKDVEGTDVSVTANLNGNFLEKTDDKLDNLKTFAEGAKEIQGVSNKEVTITATANGNVFERSDDVLNNLTEFAEGAKELQGSDSKDVAITADIKGNIATWSGSFNDLRQFAVIAKELQGTKGSNVVVTAGIEGTINEGNVSTLERFASVVNSLPTGAVNLSVKASIDTANIDSAMGLLERVANSGLFKDYNASVKVTVTGKDDVDTLKTSIENVKDKTVNVTAKTFGIEGVNALKAAIDALKSKTITITTVYQTIYGGSGGSRFGMSEVRWNNGPGDIYQGAYDPNGVNGTANANGTAFARGTAFKQGNWGAKNSGTALMGELGREIIVRGSQWFTVGDNGAEFVKYKKGDIVFNHRQSEELLNNGRVVASGGRAHALANGTAFADGTAYSSGSGGGFWGNDTIYSGSSNTSNSSSSSDTKYGSNSEENNNQVFDWIEKLLDRFDRAIDSLDAAANNIYKSFDKRNTSLSSEISKVTEQIENQQKAYDRYMAEADYVGKDGSYDLTEEWRKKIRDGDFDVSVLNDEKLIEYIGYYEEWYEKALDAKEAIEELKETLSSLYAQRVENVATQYEGILGVIEHEKNVLEEYINQSETQAWLVSSKYYDALAANERETIAELENQKAEMLAAFNEAMDSGTIDVGSESYYEMVSAIDEVTLALQESQTQLLEYSQTIQELDNEIFDLLQEKISSVTEETEFLIELLSSSKLYDDDGKLTNEGKSTMGLHGVAYNTLMTQADQAGIEAERLKKELESDPYDTELEARYREMIALQQEYILSAQSEKEAIRDLVEEGIQFELDALDERIEKYNEALESQKDLYDYQKKVKEQTKEIASIEKQLASYEGFTDEETKAKVQQLKVEFEEAKSDLEDTEYDRYISDTQQMLDNLALEYEETLNARLDNIDYLVEQMIAEINSDASIIGDTIREATDKVGYTLTDSMKTIWDEDAVSTKNVITTYGDKFLSAQTTTNTALNNINTNLQNMINQLNTKATANTKSASTSSTAKSSSSKTTKTKTTTKKTSGGDGTPKIGDRVKYVSGQYYYDSQGKKPLGSHKQGEYVYITNINTRDWATHGYHISTGNKLGKGDLGWLKLNQISGYADGKKNFSNDEIAWTQEDGREFIVRPSDGAILTPIAKTDSVLTSVASNNIWKMANSPAEFIKDNLNLGATNVPNNSNVQSNYTQHLDKVIFNLPNVQNYEQLLSSMQKDKNFEKLVLSMTIDRVAGKSSLAKGKSLR